MLDRFAGMAAEHGSDYVADSAASSRASGVSGGGTGDASRGAAEGLSQVERELAGAAVSVRGVSDLIPTADSQSAVAMIDTDQLDRCLSALRGLEGAVAAVKSSLIGCARSAKAHQAAGMAGTDQYLRDRLGLSAGEAKKQSELARRLESMGQTRQALADGRLGAEQAGLLSRAASQGSLGSPDQVEQALLDTAIVSSPEQLRETIRQAQHAADGDVLRRDENRVHASRRASISHKPDGSWELFARLDAIAGEKLATCLRAYLPTDGKEVPVEQRRSYQQRAADALETIADTALASTGVSQGGVRPHISVLVPWRLLDQACRNRLTADGTPDSATGPADASHTPDVDEHGDNDDADPHDRGDPGVTGTTGQGITLSTEATSRLMCDSRITRIVLDAAGQPIDVGRATRVWTAAQRSAVAARDRGCRGPGCDRPVAWCDIHHIQWWSNNGPSDLGNTLMLCSHHHRLIHQHRWHIDYDPATAIATFTDPAGNTVRTHPPPPPGGT